MAKVVSRRREGFGLLLALTGSVGLGAAIAIARIAYAEGANGLSIAFPRAWLLVILLLAFCGLTRRRLRLPRAAWPHCLGAGVLMAYLFYGNIAAAEFIAAPVAALLFFIYPPLTTLLAAAVDRRAPSPVKLIATGIAFAGLAVMLGANFSGLDWRGVALGLSAGTLCAVQMVWISRRLRIYDPVVTMTYMSAVAALGLTAAVLLVDGPPAPSGQAGWAALAGAALLQAMSIPLLYVALPVIGPERSGALNNVQPVSTIAVAYLALGERLRAAQFLGAAMILGGILLMQWASARGRN